MDFITDEQMGQLERSGQAKLSLEPHKGAPDFISDDEMETLQPQKQSPKGSAGMAALEHYGNAATAGYLPHLQALTEKLMPDPSGGVDAQMRKQGFKIDQQEPTYVQSRDANLRRLAEQSKESPYASGIGTVSGIIGGGIALGPLAKAAGVGANAVKAGRRIVQGAKAGAVLGAVSNPGDTAGEVDPLQIGDRAKGGLIGAAFGGAAQGAVEGVSAGAKKASQWLGEKAAKKAARAIGRPTPTQATEMARTGEDVALGREMLDQGAVPVLGTPKRIAKRIDKLREKSWDKIDDMLGSAGDNQIVDGVEASRKLLNSKEYALLKKTPGAEGTVKSIEDAAVTLSESPNLSLREAQAIKKSIDKQINFNKRMPDMQGKQQAMLGARTVLRDEMNESAGRIVGKDALKDAFKKHGKLEKAAEIAEREAGRQQANRAVSLTDTIAGVGGGAAGGPGVALLTAAANKFGRTFGNSIQARGFDSGAKFFAKTPALTAFANQNPMVAQVIAQRLANPSEFENVSDDPVLKNPQLMEIFKQNPGLIDNVEDLKLKAELEKRFGRKPASPPESPIERRLNKK